jgi:hypothetical protein
MARFFLVLVFFVVTSLHADIFDFVSGTDGNNSRIESLINKLKSLEMKDGPGFEENFNQLIKGIENAVEDEKLYCSGESTNSEGKTLPVSQKQYCMRELKKKYQEATKVIFEIKKKYLVFIHERQLQRLNEIQTKMQTDIDKSF